MDFWKRHRGLLAVLAAVAAAYFFWGGSRNIGDLLGDGPSYLMLAEHLSFLGDKDPVWDHVGALSRFPPGYPLLLAICGASADLWRAHAVTILCLPLALLAYYLWLLEQGFNRTQSTLLVILIALLPSTLWQGLRIQSEYLYLALSALALLLLNRCQRSPGRSTPYAAALVIAAAILTREVGLSLLPSLALCLRRVSARTALIGLAIAVLPFVDWHVLHHAPVTYSQILAGTYGGNAFQQIKDQLAAELPALRLGFSSALSQREPPLALSDILGLVCLAAACWRALQFKPDAVYAAANIVILAFWPFPEESSRFLWVLMPILLVQPPLLLAQWRRQSCSASIPAAALVLIAATVLSMTLPAVYFVAGRYRTVAAFPIRDAHSQLNWYLNDVGQAVIGSAEEEAIIDALSYAQTVVPTDDCILSPRYDIAAYFSRRRSYEYAFPDASNAAFDQRIHAVDCHYALVYAVTDRIFSVPMYPAGRMAAYSDVVWRSELPVEAGQGRRTLCELLKLHGPNRAADGK